MKGPADIFYFLSQLKRAQIKSNELITFYLTCIRPVTEYACALFHNSLPKYLAEDLESSQKRALRIIFPQKCYEQALEDTGLPSLQARREHITAKLFREITDDPSHKLYSLLPPKNTCGINLRRRRTYTVPKVKTDRLRNLYYI